MKKAEINDLTEKIKKERKEKNNIRKQLLELNFNINSNGFNYWIEGIILYKNLKNEQQKCKMGFINNKLSEVFETTESAIERALRTCSLRAIPNIRKKYNYYGKIGTKTIFELLVMEE